MNWIKETWKYLKGEKTKVEEEREVPRHRWVPVSQAFDYLNKEVEIHEDSSVFGHTTVRGRLTSISYESFEDRTTLEIQGSNFVATVDLYRSDKFIAHL